MIRSASYIDDMLLQYNFFLLHKDQTELFSFAVANKIVVTDHFTVAFQDP